MKRVKGTSVAYYDSFDDFMTRHNVAPPSSLLPSDIPDTPNKVQKIIRSIVNANKKRGHLCWRLLSFEDGLVLKGHAFGIVLLEPDFRGVRGGEDLDVLAVANLLAELSSPMLHGCLDDESPGSHMRNTKPMWVIPKGPHMARVLNYSKERRVTGT